MAKALKVAAVVIGGAALIATGVGAIVGAAAVTAAIGVSATTLALAAGALGAASSLLTKAPTIPNAQTERLVASIDPRAFRKTVLGETALPVAIVDA